MGNTKGYWNYGDNRDKEFLDVVDPKTRQPVHISTIEIGRPACLLLPNGDIVTTGPVQEWSIYGGTRIRTKKRTYWMH